MSKSAYVYVVATVRAGVATAPVKVGISENPQSRLSSLQTGSSFDLEIIYAFPIPLRDLASIVEQAFHQAHTDQRLRGEWFDMEPSVAVLHTASIVCELCSQTYPGDEPGAVRAAGALGAIEALRALLPNKTSVN